MITVNTSVWRQCRCYTSCGITSYTYYYWNLPLSFYYDSPPCQAASSLMSRTSTPPQPLSAVTAVLGLPVRESHGGKESFQSITPPRWRPLNHRVVRACCCRPRRVFSGRTLHGYPESGVGWSVGVEVWRGGVFTADGGAHQQRQAGTQ